ncbi:MAG: putative metal-binding motif-containing protein, partial [Chloroflexi bacterium]|nr:putative metal-binding motif-containing protein [Chloroflexota bacterium]
NPSFAETVEVDCYRDGDGDGYAANNAVRVHRSVEVADTVLLSPRNVTNICADASFFGRMFHWAPQTGDCDDSNSNVHPYKNEWSNGLDDDCDGFVDEPTFSWPAQTSQWSHGETWGYFWVKFNDERVLRLGDDGSKVEVQLEVETLGGETVLQDWQWTQVSSTQSWAELVLEDLDPGSVHEVRVREVRLGKKVIPQPQESFFTVTLASQSPLDVARADVVLAALHEYGVYSISGLVGYEGRLYPDGTRYLSGTLPGQNWCSEFYSEVISGAFDGPSARWIGGLADDFIEYDSYYREDMGGWANPTDMIAEMGDWLWFDQNDYSADSKDRFGVDDKMDDGHTVMFLAYKEDIGRIYYISGNDGNRVRLGQIHVASQEIKGGGLGKLTKDMLR